MEIGSSKLHSLSQNVISNDKGKWSKIDEFTIFNKSTFLSSNADLSFSYARFSVNSL